MLLEAGFSHYLAITLDNAVLEENDSNFVPKNNRTYAGSVAVKVVNS